MRFLFRSLKTFVFILAFISFLSPLKAQIPVGKGTISGDFMLNGMFYIPDSLIGADKVDSKVRANSYMYLQYTNGGFTAGMRYEFYLYPLIDFEDIGYKGHGITHYFADYKNDFIQVTAGTFYEQFGSGLTLRSYEDKYLGIDNSILGARVKVTPYKGITLKGVWGIQRKNFDFEYLKRKDHVRGIDGEISLTELIPQMSEKGFSTSLGASFVSKYEKDEDPTFILPQNVATWGARLNFGWKGLRFEGEYARKINDPNATNEYIYKPGDALFASLTYSMKGFGISTSFIRADNMDFRSQRGTPANLALLNINYIPAINRQYSYQLISNYSYASQPNGQVGAQCQVNYQIPKKTKLGGKYGVDITLNYARYHTIDRAWLPEDSVTGSHSGTDGYTSNFFKWGKEVLYQDLGVEISHKFDKRWKLILAYNWLIYNMEVLQGHGGMFHGHNIAADLTCKINSKHALRLEAQHLYSKDDLGSWVYAMLEYSINPHWFISIGDQWNYGNADKSRRIHYYNISAAFAIKTTRIALSYGKTREGILCVGGVCRTVPASYGLGLSVTTSF